MSLHPTAFYQVIRNEEVKTKAEFPWRLVFTTGGKAKPVTCRYTVDDRETKPALFRERRHGEKFLRMAREGTLEFGVMDA